MSIKSLLTDLANSVRAKSGLSGPLTLAQMAQAIAQFRSLTETEDATATSGDMADGVTAYVNSSKITGSLPKWNGFVSQNITPSYDSENAKIVLSSSQTKDVILKSGQKNCTLKSAASNFGDATEADVRTGKTFTSTAGLKVVGAADIEGGGIDTSDATAVPEDILSSKTAYANGRRITGTIPTQDAQTITPGASDQVLPAGVYLGGDQTVQGDPNLIPANIKSGVSIFGVDGTAESSGKYIWAIYEFIKWGETKTTIGKTKPEDCGSTSYGSVSITDDGYYKLSGTVLLSKYYYIAGQEANPKSVYYEAWAPAGSNTFYRYTLSEEPVNQKGAFISYIVSNDDAAYPSDGVQDGKWYTRVTAQEGT